MIEIGDSNNPCSRFGAVTIRPGATLLETVREIQALDLVVTAETMIAHLAAIAGVETWMPLHHLRNWPWVGGDAKAWYPEIRVFHQQDTWRATFEEMAQELSQRLGQEK